MLMLPISSEHIDDLSENIRPKDHQEIMAYSDGNIHDIIEYHIDKSDVSFAATIDDGLLAVVGVVPQSSLRLTGIPWILTTTLLDKHPRFLVKYSKPVLEVWLHKYDKLFNIVDSRYEQALRWVKWMGFTIHEPKLYEGMDVEFCAVEKSKDK